MHNLYAAFHFGDIFDVQSCYVYMSTSVDLGVEYSVCVVVMPGLDELKFAPHKTSSFIEGDKIYTSLAMWAMV